MMKRFLPLVLLLALSAWPSGSLRSQPAPVPVTPQPPIPPDPHMRRHRMGDGSIRRLDTDSQFKAALKAHIDELRARMALLEDRLQNEQDLSLEMELSQLKQQLSALDSLKPLNLPDAVVVDPDPSKRVFWDREGNEVVILDPDLESRHKTRGERVAYFSHLYVNHDDWVDGPAVAIMGNVHVIGHVEEDVVSVGGNVYVDGTVGGNVVAPFGDVYLSSEAYVEGNVVAVSVSADDQAQIGGKIEEIPLFRLPWVNGGPQALLKLASTVALTKVILLLVLGLLILAVAPLHVARVEERVRQKPVSSFFGGMLVQFLIFPVFVLLLVTVIGIPLAILALPLLILASLLLGFVAISRLIGDRLSTSEGGPRTGILQYMAGALILFSPLLAASGLALSKPELAGSLLWVVNLLFFLGVCVLYLVYTAGMGAAVFSRLGTRSPGAVRPSKPPKAGVTSSLPPPSALPQAPPAAGLS